MTTLTPQIIERIKSAVIQIFGVEGHAIDSPTRTQRVANARFVYRALAYEMTDLGVERLGREFGCDHGTVSWAVHRMKELSAADPVYRGKCGIVRSMIALPSVQPMHQDIAA